MQTKQNKLGKTTRGKRGLFFAVLLAAGCALLAQTAAAQFYQVTNLSSLGGTNSRGNSINNRGWIAGYSNFAGNQRRHAALWREGVLTDLGTLGSPDRNSNVTWSVKNNNGLVVGISQTDTPEPLGERWSCSAFFPPATATGYTCLGFVWENGVMRSLPTLGGNNGFATGANNRKEIVGWAENNVQDPTCVAPQVLQFRSVVWGPKEGQIRELPLVSGDTSSAATAINNKGQVVGISGICDQSVGRHTARHAVLWDKGEIIDLGNLGAAYWNTPTNINQRGDIVGFAGVNGDVDGNILQAFIWTRKEGMKRLLPLQSLGHVHAEAYGINERRQVVGVSCDADFVDCRAVLWENGTVKDLNDLIAGSFPGRLEQAKDINEAGEITGRAISPAGVRTAFSAVPVAEGKLNKKSVLSENQAKIVLPTDLKQAFYDQLGISSNYLFR